MEMTMIIRRISTRRRSPLLPSREVKCLCSLGENEGPRGREEKGNRYEEGRECGGEDRDCSPQGNSEREGERD
jgi:hypothetical protein